MPAIPVLLKLTPAAERAGTPSLAHPGDAGLDLRSDADVTINPGRRATIGTGIAVALPNGYAAYVLPRSGLAARHGITVLNSPGTIDAGYRGEIKVTLLNTDTEDVFVVRPGDRIAQLILQPVHSICFTQVDRLPGSSRGDGGHGSTGGFGKGDGAVHSQDTVVHDEANGVVVGTDTMGSHVTGPDVTGPDVTGPDADQIKD